MELLQIKNQVIKIEKEHQEVPYCEGKQNPNEGDARFLRIPSTHFNLLYGLCPSPHDHGICDKFLQLFYDIL